MELPSGCVTIACPTSRRTLSVLLVSVGATVADAENFNMLDPTRSAELDDIALTCLYECSGYW